MYDIFNTCIKKYFLPLLFIGVLVLSVSVGPAFASTLTAITDTLSDTHEAATGVTHTLAFTTATTSTILNISFQFSTASGGSTKPAGLNLSSSTLGTITNLNGGWSLSTANASTGKLSISRSAASGIVPINSSTAASVALQNITNSALGNCISSSGTLGDTCYVTTSTYSDTAGTLLVDSGEITYDVFQDPTFTFTVSSVSAGTTNNGVTSTLASTATSLQFGTISPSQVVYVTHKLFIKTNAPHGYTITAALASLITGNNTNDTVNPFGAVNATWTTPQLWSTPNGTTRNNNSAWFGANTTDTRVTGWSSNTSAKFGPISQTPNIVSYSSTSDPTGTTVYLSYALGTNTLQPTDYYLANILYNVQATY
jgi:hypothetical protein